MGAYSTFLYNFFGPIYIKISNMTIYLQYRFTQFKSCVVPRSYALCVPTAKQGTLSVISINPCIP